MTEQEATVTITSLIHDCIKDAGEQGIPSGHLYSMLIRRVGFETYTDTILALKSAGKIRESNNVLTSI